MGDPELHSRWEFERRYEAIEREERILNNRLTWSLAFHGFLAVAATGLFATKAGPSSPRPAILLVATIGAIVAGLTVIGAVAAYMAISKGHSSGNRVGSIVGLNLPGEKGRTHYYGMAPGLGIPLVLLVAWLMVEVSQLGLH